VKQESTLTMDISANIPLNMVTAQIYTNPARHIPANLSFTIVFALLMAISANSFIYLPFTPVPMTLQVMTVLLSGLVLGSRWALISQVIYISLGLAGLPVFAGFKPGALAIAGPTGGYILGFSVAAFVTGYIYHDLKKSTRAFKNSLLSCFISCAAGIILIHLSGYIHLFGYLYNTVRLTGPGPLAILTWKLGTQPFLVVEFIKLFIILNIFEIRKN
ncbi:MAG: biotin transporter BioY, partial [Actinobacteria bacterium]|nr:biotin transporter BioY [Actinomycetota bacterium]